jgi:hypothetical protein
MDKKLLKAYIRTIVEEEIERLFPKMLKEHLGTVSKAELVSETTTTAPSKPAFSKSELASLLGITREGDTIRATTRNLGPGASNIAPAGVPADLAAALNKDYSKMLRDIDAVKKNRQG